MRRVSVPWHLLAISLTVFGAACAVRLHVNQDSEMLQLASSLTKLSRAVEFTVHYRQPPDEMTDDALIALATRDDPTLRTPFARLGVRVLRKDRHSVELVCTADGSRALLEGAGCTAKLDRRAWQESPAAPCAFTLQVAKVCPRSGTGQRP